MSVQGVWPDLKDKLLHVSQLIGPDDYRSLTRSDRQRPGNQQGSLLSLPQLHTQPALCDTCSFLSSTLQELCLDAWSFWFLISCTCA
jgi:hypothetical protein